MSKLYQFKYPRNNDSIEDTSDLNSKFIIDYSPAKIEKTVEL